MGVLDSITNKEPRLNMDAAVNKQIFKEDLERRTEKEKQRESKGKMKKGGKGIGLSHTLPTKVVKESSLATLRARTGVWVKAKLKRKKQTPVGASDTLLN